MPVGSWRHREIKQDVEQTRSRDLLHGNEKYGDRGARVCVGSLVTQRGKHGQLTEGYGIELSLVGWMDLLI